MNWNAIRSDLVILWTIRGLGIVGACLLALVSVSRALALIGSYQNRARAGAKWVKEGFTSALLIDLTIWITTFFLFWLLSGWLTGWIVHKYLGPSTSRFLVFIFALAAWFPLFFITFKYFTLEVPVKQIWVTTNYFRKTLCQYGRGLHLRKPWEVVGQNISTESRMVDTRQNPIKILVEDGYVFIQTLVIWRPDQSWIEIFINFKEDDISAGIQAKVTLFFVTNLAGLTVAKAKGKLKELSDDCEKIFGGIGVQSPDEKRYGIIVENPKMFSLTADQESEEAMVLTKRAEKLAEAVKALRKEDPALTQKEATDRVLALWGKTKMESHVVEAPQTLQSFGGFGIVGGNPSGGQNKKGGTP